MRLGIALRLIGVLVLGSLVVVEGGAMKNRVFEGKSEHYTVVLAADANAQAISAADAKHGVKVDTVISTDSTKAFTATMTSGEADNIRSNAQVSYIEMDSQKTVHHTWWDSTLIALGFNSAHFS